MSLSKGKQGIEHQDVILGDTLFKKSIDGNLLVCLDESKVYVTLGEVHEGICRDHQVGEKMKWVLR